MFKYRPMTPWAAALGTGDVTPGWRPWLQTLPVLALLFVLCSLPASAIAQAQRAQDTGVREIVVHNLAPVPREEWCTAVVPFAKGAVAATPDLHVAGHATVWQPFGARWPDGSVRQALCMFRTALGQLQEKVLALEPGRGPALANVQIDVPEFDVEFQVRTPGSTTRARPEPIEVLESNQARKVVLMRCRIGDTGLVGELIVTAYRDQPHASADVAVFFSDPTTEAMQVSIEELAVECQGMALFFRHAKPLGVIQAPTERGSRAVLLEHQVLGDGMGIRRTGALVPALQGNTLPSDTFHAAVICPPFAATSWQNSGAFGAFGYVPEPPPWLAGNQLRQAMLNRHRSFLEWSNRPGDPFANGPWGLARLAGQTGDQRDFGVVKLESVAGTGIPSFLFEVELSVLQEACRPVHFFETDGSPILAENHPNWVVWSGRTHWHGGVSRDRLGKPVPEPRFEDHGWWGKDRQHWSTNYLAAWYLLTGQHWAKRELENEVQLYMSGQTVRPALSTSGPGAPRGAGRVMLAACWLYLCTGDEKLLERMHQRVNRVYYPTWPGRDLQDKKVRTMAIARPDPRMLQGATNYWTPWQDALAAVGFAAFHRLTGNNRAGELAVGLSTNVVRHGWQVSEELTIIATAIRWKGDASPPTPAELSSGDPTVVLWSHGTDFSTWSIGAVELARIYAAEDGDTELENRANRILTWLRRRRAPPFDRWFDRFGQWDAVR